jgi:hypothetical protein
VYILQKLELVITSTTIVTPTNPQSLVPNRGSGLLVGVKLSIGSGLVGMITFVYILSLFGA